MTHEQFLRQLILVNTLPQALLTLIMRESVKSSPEARVELLQYIRRQTTDYRAHEADMQEAIAKSQADVLALQNL